MIHAGLICLNGPVGMDLDMQIKLFETALDELDQNSDLINQVLEITLDDANDAEFTIIRYELPTLPFPFPEGAARRTPGSPGPGGEGCNTVCAKFKDGVEAVASI
jgi:hypothetical protein